MHQKQAEGLLKDLSNVVINTECEGICYRIYAWQKFQIQARGHY